MMIKERTKKNQTTHRFVAPLARHVESSDLGQQLPLVHPELLHRLVSGLELAKGRPQLLLQGVDHGLGLGGVLLMVGLDAGAWGRTQKRNEKGPKLG